jgi:hypothetical protein
VDLDFEYNLAHRKAPQTNGPPWDDCRQAPAGQPVERLPGWNDEVLQNRHFRYGEDLETTLHVSVLGQRSATASISAGQKSAYAGGERRAQTQAPSL